MNINAVNFNSIQKTNFGLITNQARERLNSLINKENSGMDEDGRVKLSYFETSHDFILHYYKYDNSFKFNSINYHASTGLKTTEKYDEYINVGDFLRKLYIQSEKLPDVEKTAAKREKPLTLDYFNKK